MRPRDVTSFLETTLPARLPILLTGAPGVGKSDLVAQAAAGAGCDLIISHPVVADPTDAKGLPWPAPDGRTAHFLPFGDMARALSAESPTVWFLDDLGQASPAVQASFMQLLLARRVNGHVLPEHVTFVAATNRRTDRAGVSGILEPVKSRFASIVEVEANLDDWSAWALDHDQPVELVAFLRFRPDLLHVFAPTADLTNSPSPRTWANAGRLVALALPPALELPALGGAVGAPAAAELVAFLRMVRDPALNLDAILLSPDTADIPTAPSALYAVATGLAARATAANFGRIARYCERLAAASKAEFAVLTLRDCVRRDKAVCLAPAFVRLASGPLGKLVAGG